MGKNEIRGYIVDAILLIVFSVIAFAAPFAKTGVFWMAYLFGVIAIAYQIYVFQISFNQGDDVKSKFYGFPIARVGVIYLAVQLVLSLIEMCLAASTFLTDTLNKPSLIERSKLCFDDEYSSEKTQILYKSSQLILT